MKKLFAIMLALILLLTACGSPAPVEQEDPISTPEIVDPIVPEEPAKLTRGTWDGNVFTNDSISLKITFPSWWTHASDEELAATLGNTKEYMAEDLFDAAMETTLYDLQAIDPLTGDNIVLSYENLSQSTGYTDNLDEETYLELLKQQADSGLSMELAFADTFFPVELNGLRFMGLESSVTFDGIDMTQYYFVRKHGEHMICVICTALTLSMGDFVAMFN